MNNGLIVICDGLILANLLALALLLCSDFRKFWFAFMGLLIFITAGLFVILTVGDIAIWMEKIDRPLWFMDRELRASWRAPLGVILTAINIFVGVRRRG